MGEVITVDCAEYDGMRHRIAELERELDSRDALLLDRSAECADESDYLPLDCVKRLVSGVHPVRVWRERRGLTTQALADLSGMTRSYITAIETRAKPGSVSAYQRLAKALAVAVEDLLPAVAKS